ncbi:MAG: hypothetical protein IKZ61_02020 [Prevotella sp.]|nr:hypothetical protein [Prevotella sp.]
MKRIYSTLMMIAMMAVATISLNSCSVADDIDKSINKAIDNTQLKGKAFSNYSDGTLANNTCKVFKFYKDGSVILLEVVNDVAQKSEGSWVVSGNNVTIKMKSGKRSKETFKGTVGNSTLYLTIDGKSYSFNDGYNDIYKKYNK